MLYLPLKHSNIDVLYVSAGLKINKTRRLDSLSILEKKDPNHTNAFASNIIDKYENRLNKLITCA